MYSVILQLVRNHLTGGHRTNSGIKGYRSFLFFIFCVTSLSVGFTLHWYLPDPGQLSESPGLNGLVFYSLLLLSFVSAFMSKSTDFPLQQYVHLPVEDSALVRVFLLFRILNPFNLFLFGSLTVFFVIDISQGHPILIAAGSLCLVTILLIIAGLLSVLISYLQLNSPAVYQTGFFLLIGFGIIYLLNIVGLLPFDILRIHLCLASGNGTVLIPLLLLMGILVYYLSSSAMKNLLYVDRLTSIGGAGRRRSNESTMIGANALRWTEYRLLWRNPRSRVNFFLIAGNVLLCGLWLIAGILGPRLPLIFGTLLLINTVTGYYTVHAFRLRSTIFDRLVTFPIEKHEPVELIVRFSQMIILMTLLVILSVSYIINPESVFFVLSTYIYTLGILVYLHTYAGSFQTTRFDPALSSFSSEHTSVSHPWHNITALLLGTVPPGLVVILPENPLHWSAWIFLLLPGVFGLVYHKTWISLITRRFTGRRYEILEGFRG